MDDNSGILQVVSAILSAITDTQIDCYESGEHALRDYDAHPDEVDLVITDLDMPGMNGLELCQALRRRRGDLKIVLMTGNHSAIDPDSARLCGFDGLMYKPFLPIDLRKLLENVGALEQRPAQGTTRWSRAI